MIDYAKVSMLPYDELTEAMLSENSERLITGGSVDFNNRAVFLYTGKMKRLIVPFDWFVSFFRPIPIVPDFNDLQIIDYGQTVRLGEYEASTPAILEYTRHQRW